MTLIIQQIDNYWMVNKKRLPEMTKIERNELVNFLKNIHEKTIKHL